MKNTHRPNARLQKQLKQVEHLFVQGHKKEALEKVQDLVARNPEHPRLLATLGYLLGQNKKLQEGLNHLHQALQKDSKDTFIRFFYAELLNKNHEFSRALATLEPVEKVKNKKDLFGYYKHSAAAYEGLGQLDQAWTNYREALALDPTDSGLLFRASSYLHFQDPDDPLILTLHQQLANKHLGDFNRSIIHYTLGKAYQDLKNTGSAFEHYQKANQLMGLQREPGLNLEVMLRDLEAFYQTQANKKNTPQGLNTQREVLIIGVSRGGKSLLETLVASHPQVTAGGEDLTFFRLASGATGQHQGPLNYLKQVKNNQNSAYARHYQQQRNWPATPFLTNTLPMNLHLLNIYAAWFPAAPIIFIKRDYRDQGLACYFKYYSEENAYSFDLYQTGREIALSERLMDFWMQHLPNPCIQVRYEDLVQKPAATSRLIYRFLGLDWQPDYFAHLQNQKDFTGTLAPHQSLDGSASLREDYIGWSQAFADYLEPLHQGYQEAMRLDLQPRQDSQLKQQATLEACKEDLKNHNYQRALKQANRLLERRPDQPQFLQLAGITASLAGLDAQALSFFEKAQRFLEGDLGISVNQVRALLRAGQSKQAQQLWQELDNKQPAHSAVKQLGIEVLVEGGSNNKKRLQEGLEQLELLLERQPQDSELLYFKARLQQALKQKDLATSSFEAALHSLEAERQQSTTPWRLAPLHTRLLYAYARFLGEQPKPDAEQVIALLWQACRQHPLSRTSVESWSALQQWLGRSSKEEHKALDRLHQRTQRIWKKYSEDELEHSFGDFGLPYQSFEPLMLPGTRPAMQRLNAYQLQDWLPASARALDIGCNHGYLLLGLADQLESGVGFDISRSCIQVGQAVAEQLGVSDKIHLEQSTFDDFCQQTHQPFDLVIACAVHSWIGRPLTEFGRQLYDWCKPGGLVLVESQGSRQREHTEPNFDYKVEQMQQAGFICIQEGDLCDDEINYRKFKLLQRPDDTVTTGDKAP